jgi:pimeloyl-ACP methyl ester carboxylesterase
MIDLPGESAAIDVDGLPTFVTQLGSGEPLLLIHGSGPGNAGFFSWAPVLEQLAEEFRVLVVDMPGYGRSAPLRVADTPANVGRHLVRLLDVLGHQTANVIGHSRGGRIACELVINAPERVDRLVVVGSGSVAPGGHVSADGGWTAPALALVKWGADGDLGYESFRDAYLTQVVRPENLPDDWLRKAYDDAAALGVLEYFVEQMALHDPLTFYHQEDAAVFQQKLRGIVAPTLVLWGREDTCSSYERAVPLVEVIRTAELVILPDCEHFITMDRPEAFVSHVLAFLRRPAENLAAVQKSLSGASV